MLMRSREFVRRQRKIRLLALVSLTCPWRIVLSTPCNIVTGGRKLLDGVFAEHQGRSYALSLTVGFLEQDEVGVGMAAEYAEALSVRRPTEIENLL